MEIPGTEATRSLVYLIDLKTINLFYLDYKIGIFVLRDMHIHFPLGVQWDLPYQPSFMSENVNLTLRPK